MTNPQQEHSPDQTDLEPPKLNPEEIELQRQVMAHVRDFGSRKYLAFYTQAKNLKESGVDAATVRKSLIAEVPNLPAAPEGGVHFISKVHRAKQVAIYHVVCHAVEDALARRPALFREEYAKSN